MAILDLDKIVFKKPDNGIRCLRCGGDLKQIEKMTWFGKMAAFVILGKANMRHYQCDNCKKKYIVI